MQQRSSNSSKSGDDFYVVSVTIGVLEAVKNFDIFDVDEVSRCKFLIGES